MGGHGGDNSGPAWHSFVAGNVGGVFGMSISFPFDTVKTRIQMRPTYYKGTVDVLTRMTREEGFLSIYRGILFPVFGYGAINAVAFGTYENVKEYLSDDDGNISAFKLYFAAGLSGYTSAFVRAPIEQVKCVMQARVNATDPHKAPFKTSIHCCAHLIKTEGAYRGLFKGVVATQSREIPQYAMYFPIYEYTRRGLKKAGLDEKGTAMTIAAGGIAGAGQWIPTYPFDVVKTKIQSEPDGTYKGFMDCARKTYKSGGATVFFRGLMPALVRAFPLHAGVFLGFETTMRILDPDRINHMDEA